MAEKQEIFYLINGGRRAYNNYLYANLLGKAKKQSTLIKKCKSHMTDNTFYIVKTSYGAVIAKHKVKAVLLGCNDSDVMEVA